MDLIFNDDIVKSEYRVNVGCKGFLGGAKTSRSVDVMIIVTT